MRALLDTHVFLWLHTARRRLAPAVLRRLADPDTELYLSAASAWEIAITHELGRLPLPEPARDPFDRLLVAQARRHDLVLVTADPTIQQDPAHTLAAS